MLFWSFLISCWRFFSFFFRLSSFCLISSALSSYDVCAIPISTQAIEHEDGKGTHKNVVVVPLLAHALHLAAREVLLLLAGLLTLLQLRL